MNTRDDLDLFYAFRKDKKGNLLFQAIKDNDENRLSQLIAYQADIRLVQNGYNCIQYAAVLGHWQCVDLLIQASQLYLYPKYLHRLGLVLLLASKSNKMETVEKCFELLALTKKHVKVVASQRVLAQFTQYDDAIIFPKIDGPTPKPWRDKQNGYTALHWAVQHGNAKICNLFVKFFLHGCGTWLSGGDHRIFTAKNNAGQTAFDLAIGLNDDCAQQIAGGMTFSFVKNYASDEIFIKTLLKNIRFDLNIYQNTPAPGFAENPGIMSRYVFPATYKRTKLIYKYFTTLSDQDKKIIGELMLTDGTTLNLFFRNIFSYKYQSLILKELKTMENSTLEVGFDTKSIHKSLGSTLSSGSSEKSLDKTEVKTEDISLPQKISLSDDLESLCEMSNDAYYRMGKK